MPYILPEGMIINQETEGQITQTLEGTLMQTVPQNFKTYRSEITTTRNFKRKIDFFSGEGAPAVPSSDPFPHGLHYSPPTKPSGSASASPRIPARFTPRHCQRAYVP